MGFSFSVDSDRRHKSGTATNQPGAFRERRLPGIMALENGPSPTSVRWDVGLKRRRGALIRSSMSATMGSMSESADVPSLSASQCLKYWAELGAPLRFNRIARFLNWEPARQMVRAAEPVLRANSGVLRSLLKKSNALLAPLKDPLLTDYGACDWLSHSREEAYSDSLKLVLKQIAEPQQLLRVLAIEDPTAEVALSGVRPDWGREVFTPEGHEGHTGKMDLQLVIPGKVLIQVELKLGSADDSDVEKGKGYSRSTYGVPPGHRHRRLLATDGNESPYPGGYELVKWKHVATQLRIVAAQMVAGRRLLAALKVLGFVGAIEQNLLGFSSYDAESAFKEEPMHLSTGLIEHVQDSITGVDYDAKSKKRVG